MDQEEDSSSLVLDPLSLSDIKRNINNRHSDERDGGPEPRQRRLSHVFSVAMGLKRSSCDNNGIRRKTSWVRRCWKKAAFQALHAGDPWEEFHLQDLETEVACRYRYNAYQQNWKIDEVHVKIAKEPFNHGAMRECYRLKKISSFCHSHDWRTACNYVAKRYMDPVDREVYFADAKLQMDAKLWGEEYNRHNPPKKVDIFQMSVIEFINRPGKPLYHLEHYIEGDYVKYNSNSGFISSENVRLTPQAFSHFTFERSGHELIVVDIQGVGDLYTDPQIHTASGFGYGDGNLGTKGMALFFYSHICNQICESLGLSQFDLASCEIATHHKVVELQKYCKTVVRGTEELCISPSAYEKTHLAEFLRSRSKSGSISENTQEDTPFDKVYHSQVSKDSGHYIEDRADDDLNNSLDCNDNKLNSFPFSHDSDSGLGSWRNKQRRKHYDSESSDTLKNDLDRTFSEIITRKSRPSCVQHEIFLRKQNLDDGYSNTSGSVLGQIHLDLAKYHEIGRFTPEGNDSYDHAAALFHLNHAADCGNLDAIKALYSMYLHLPHDILTDIVLDVDVEKGMEYMRQAAHAGDRSAMIHLAKAFDHGNITGYEWKQQWTDAQFWYTQAIDMDDLDEGGDYDHCMHDPIYLLLARQAEMYRQGGYKLERDLQKAGELYQKAAESATAAMKGRLANQYYLLAEEVWSEMEE